MREKKGHLLIIDDNEEFLIALKLLFSPHFDLIVTESIPDRMLLHLKKHAFDVILLDMNFRAGIQSGNEGLYWMKKIRENDPDVSILFITAFGDVDLAIRSLKEGATDFIQKSWDEQKILSTVLAAMKMNQKQKEIRRLRSGQDHLSRTIDKDFRMVRGRAAAMQPVYEIMEKVAGTDANILITGESGTGKEVVAREIHRLSPRAPDLFVSVDLGTLQPTLFESELFGHKKGAFTDAHADRPGRVELASGGTLFLDEIGNLPIGLQPKLLSVLQFKAVRRLGENHERAVDFRLISATNQSLGQMVGDNAFREDLLYRLKTVEIELPPLRERREDLPELVDHFFNRFREKYKKYDLSLSGQAMNRLKKYDWPGNIRELQHAIEKAVILADGSKIQASDFHFHQEPRLKRDPEREFNLEKNEREIILKALETFSWNMTKTARELGINRSTLYDKIKKYELRQV